VPADSATRGVTVRILPLGAAAPGLTQSIGTCEPPREVLALGSLLGHGCGKVCPELTTIVVTCDARRVNGAEDQLRPAGE
jgi:hypothetical protein